MHVVPAATSGYCNSPLPDKVPVNVVTVPALLHVMENCSGGTDGSLLCPRGTDVVVVVGLGAAETDGGDPAVTSTPTAMSTGPNKTAERRACPAREHRSIRPRVSSDTPLRTRQRHSSGSWDSCRPPRPSPQRWLGR